MQSVPAIALLTFKQGIRQRILYGTLLFGALAITFSLLISGYFMRDILKVLMDLCLSVIAVSNLMVPFFLTVALLGGDLEKKSIYTILALPVSRSQYILGKYFGLGLIAIVITNITTLLSLLAIWAATFLLPDHFPSDLSITKFLIAALFSLVGILVLNGTVILWCSLTTSSFLATLLTLATYLIGQAAEDMTRFMHTHTAGMEISPVVRTIVQATLYLFPNLAGFNFKDVAAYDLPIPWNELLQTLLYGVSYTTATLILIIFIFQRRSLT